jgi:hypothetical protein
MKRSTVRRSRKEYYDAHLFGHNIVVLDAVEIIAGPL